MNTHRLTGIPGVLVPLVAVGGLVACSGDDGADADATTTVPATQSAPPGDTGDPAPPPPADTGDPAPPPPGDTGDSDPPPQGPPEDTMPAPGTRLDITEVRAGTHDGYDRIVIELTGTGSPGSALRLTDSPTADGSGFPVEYSGEQALTVAVHGTTYNDVTTTLSGIPSGVIASAKVMGSFEGTQLIVVGLTDANITLTDISTRVLTDPTRLVIDISR